MADTVATAVLSAVVANTVAAVQCAVVIGCRRFLTGLACRTLAEAVAETLVGLLQAAPQGHTVIGRFRDGSIEVAADWMPVAGVENRAG